MVAVWSAPYFRSAWCLAEWHSMLARERNHHPSGYLVLPIVYYDGENFDAEAKARSQGTKAHAFAPFRHLRGRGKRPKKFTTEVEQLCKDIVELATNAPQWSAQFPWQAPPPPGQQPFDLPSQQS